MPINTDHSDNYGLDLARLRLNAGLKQSKIAEFMRVDSSRVSRIETGEIVPGMEEVAKFALAVNTPEAREYSKYVNEEWKQIKKPGFWHPARVDLREVEGHLVRLETFLAELGVSSGARAEAEMHLASLRQAAEYLENLDHSMAFVGDIGVGKSTAICAMTNLIIEGDSKKPLRDKVVLEIGAGGTTICEVHIRSDAKNVFGLIVQPHSDEEVFRTVSDFCASLVDSHAEIEPGVRGVSQEVNRALRNMAGLVRTQTKGADGKIVRTDPAVELAKACSYNLEELTAAVLRNVRIEQRKQTEFRFVEGDLQIGLRKLQQLFSDVNNGRCTDVSLPRRIDLIVPIQLLDSRQSRLRIVDTKGVDGTAIRPDIRAYLDDPRTLTVLCSRYNNAPDPTMQALIENLVNTGADEALQQRIAMMVLPRTGEALEMRDDSGLSAETPEVGYRLKQDQISAKLAQQKGGERIPICFFDVLSDDRSQVFHSLVARIEQMRAVQKSRIVDVGQSVSAFISNYGHEQTRIAQDEVRRRIAIFLRRHIHLSERAQNVYSPLLNALRTTNARTVWASVRRNGSWPGIDVYHFLGTGAAIDAQLRSQAIFSGLDELLLNMQEDIQLSAARDYLVELRRNIPSWKTRFLGDVTSAGRELFRAVLWGENGLWSRCASRWGAGAGYRDDVASWVSDWFEEPARADLHGTVERHVQDAWTAGFVAPLAALCEFDLSSSGS